MTKGELTLNYEVIGMLSAQTDLVEAKAAVRDLVRVGLFAALTATGAVLALNLPLSPVPFTLQTMFTLMAGILLGARYGAMSQLVYVLMGTIGLPVFSKATAGVGVLIGPSGGYLVGFVMGAFIAGLLAGAVRRQTVLAGARFFGYLFAALLGLAAIYLVGTWRLSAVLEVSLGRAFALGVVPFLIPDAIKAVAAAWLGVELERRGVV